MKILSKKKTKKRKVEVVVISDVHLGTYGCHARELLDYLKSIKPKKVILNGDIVDIWQFRKSYWPKSHMRVLKYLTDLIAKGVKVEYITGNHDEMLRQFARFQHGSFRIQNNLLLELDGRKSWIFHGDVFDVTLQHARWLARLGAHGYDLLILLNRLVNFVGRRLRCNKVFLSRHIKNRVKSAVRFVSNFEQTCAETAIDNGYHYVLCGHIHHPEIRTITTPKGQVTYLNSGDWIENLTALEYYEGEWHLYHYYQDALSALTKREESPDDLDRHRLWEQLMADFNLQRA